MPRIFLPDIEIGPGMLTLKDEKAHYLSSVLRCSKGDRLSINDNRGNSFSAQVIKVSGKEVIVEVAGKQEPGPESRLHISLFQCILKGEKMDLVIQKATELGVSEIQPVVSERSQVRQTRRLGRWRKIAEEASRQSGRAVIPSVQEPAMMEGLLKTTLPATRLIFWEKGGEGLSGLMKRLQGTEDVALFTGPEGGFSESEIEAASAKGLIAVSLGKRILRAETAAIAAVSIVQFLLGDMDPC